MIFEEKYFSRYILLTDQTLLPYYFCFLKFWTLCVLQLFVAKSVMSKSQEKNGNISRMKRAFNMK